MLLFRIRPLSSKFLLDDYKHSLGVRRVLCVDLHYLREQIAIDGQDLA